MTLNWLSQNWGQVQTELTILDGQRASLLSDFSLRVVETHAFTKSADKAFAAAATFVGYDERELRRLLSVVHRHFVTNLKVLLVSGTKDKDRFKNFRELIQLNDEDANIRALVHENAERQVRTFSSLPVLQVEPFVLSDVYLDPECGALPSGRIKAERIDAFDDSPNSGGRLDLMSEVLRKLGDPNFHDAIVIQGPPGAGKSAFTLKLCARLVQEGLCPVRVRMRDLPVERNLLEAIGSALEVVEGERLTTASHTSGSQLTRLFADSTQFGDATICPYIFILDAWDEISRYTREGEGFQLRVDRLMSEVRQVFLTQRTPILRIVLTGRPSDVIANSPLLHDDTPVHTMRYLRRDQLPEYVRRLQKAMKLNRFSSSDILPLPLGPLDQYQPIWQRYLNPKPGSNEKELEVLGLPLLLHLAIRVLSHNPSLISSLQGNQTALYRLLMDQTTASAAKWRQQRDLPQDSVLPIDMTFRKDLHQVAVAITTLGGESISFTELGKRMSKNVLQKFREAKGNPFSRLVIGFFFKAGAADAIEFLHKSFREYLFAESVVETLLEYGRKANGALPERSNHWEEFDQKDPRYQILRSTLCPVLAAQSLTGEIEEHTVKLIRWHQGHLNSHDGDGPETSLSAGQWRFIRDGLADMWDWWGEGVHLRGQPYRDEHDFTRFMPPYVVELIDKSLPQDRYEMDVDPIPLRTTGHDSNLGMAFFVVTAAVHEGLLDVDDMNAGWDLGRLVRRYQVCARSKSGKELILFAPSGDRSDYFLNYVRRIQAAGWRRSKSFSQQRSFTGIVFAGADLTGLDFSGSSIAYADFSGAKLVRADLTSVKAARAILRDADLSDAVLTDLRLNGSDMQGAKCTQEQLNATLTGGPTVIPEGLQVPAHWFRPFAEPEIVP